jgi:hypothetical protein
MEAASLASNIRQMRPVIAVTTFTAAMSATSGAFHQTKITIYTSS